MYTKDKTSRITVRLSPELDAFLDRMSAAFEKPRAEVVRMILTTYMWGGKYEDEQADCDNQL